MSKFNSILRWWLRQRMLWMVTCLYLWAWSVSPVKAFAALTYGIHLFASVLIIIVAVFALTGLIKVKIGRDFISSLLGYGSGVKGLLIALVCGTLMIGPAYVIFPLLMSVKRLGARWAVVAIVLVAWAIKPQMLPIEAQFLGFPFALVRTGLIIIMAIPLGLFIEWLMPDERGSAKFYVKENVSGKKLKCGTKQEA
ncbi:MAG: hypothetical protein GXP59_02470 [Deltaproteobacteria bacterium]|nr:hypothetical protein [Deltaproteobacteria bacterium]